MKTITEAHVRAIVREEIEMVLAEGMFDGMFEDEIKILKQILKGAYDHVTCADIPDPKQRIKQYLFAVAGASPLLISPAINTAAEYSPAFEKAVIDYINESTPKCKHAGGIHDRKPRTTRAQRGEPYKKFFGQDIP